MKNKYLFLGMAILSLSLVNSFNARADIENVYYVEKFTKDTAVSLYSNIAIAKVSGYVNIRKNPDTKSDIVGKIENNSAANIVETVEKADGKWYRIHSGNVDGYIKAEYFVTGEKAKELAKEVGVTYGVVYNASSLRLREKPDKTSKILTLLSEGAVYEVVGSEGDYYKIQIDDDMTGYVAKEYIKTDTQYIKAFTKEEEINNNKEKEKLKKEADVAIEKFKIAEKKFIDGIEVVEAMNNTTKAGAPASIDAIVIGDKHNLIAPEKGIENVDNPSYKVAADSKSELSITPVSKSQASLNVKGAAKNSEQGPGQKSLFEVSGAKREAIVAYAKQFLGNPYVFGGISLTNGADCSGFTMQIFSHFGYDIGRSSRDQALRGKEIELKDIRIGDLLFYANGDYINHVALYIGDGKVIHASNSKTGIIISPMNYRTPTKVKNLLD